MKTSNLQQHSARMRAVVTGLLIVCALLVALERFSLATIRAFATGFAGGSVRALLCQAVSAAPEALFVLALWWVRDALAAFSRGEMFARPVTRMLNRVGIVLICGAAVRILVVPGACRLLGFDPGHWVAFDAASMVLGAIGVALQAIAGVLRHASMIQSELDEIF